MRTRNPARPGRRLGMAIEAWPAEDQAAWHAAFTATGRFGRQSPRVKLRQPTTDAIATCYARWLLWVRDHDPDALPRPITERTNEEAVTDYLSDLGGEVTPLVVANYAARLASALKLMVPQHDWSWLAPIIRELEGYARLASPSKRRPFIPTGELIHYGLELMKAVADATGLTDVRRAEQFRDGLMIAFLAARPLRHKNMAELELGAHLKEVGDGFFVTLPREIMKAGPSLEFPAPVRLAPFIRCYLEVHRPILAASRSAATGGDANHPTAMWLGRSGARLSYDTVGDTITARILVRFKTRLTLHDFRHCAATTIAQNTPEDYMIIRLILGHSTLATAEKHYIHAKGIEAAHRFQATMLNVRKTLAKSGQAASRRF